MNKGFLRGCGGDVKRLTAFAIAAGWAVAQTQNMHLKFSKSGRKPVFTSGTPGDRRAWLNAKSQLTKADKQAEAQTCSLSA